MTSLKLGELFTAGVAGLLLLAGGTLRADDHPDKPGVARPIGSGVIAGAIETEGDKDWFSFRPTQGGIATITLLPRNPGGTQGEFFLELFQGAQNRIAYTRGTRITYVVQPGVRYLIRVSKLTNMPAAPRGYRLKLSLPEGAASWPAAMKVVSGNLETANDVNLFTFALPAPGLVNLNIRPASVTSAPIRVFAELYDSAGNRRGHFRDSDMRLVVNTPGRYFVRVISDASAPNTGSYSVQLCTNQLATAVTTSYSGSFDVPQDRDYLKFTVSGTRRVRISSSGAPRIYAELYDAAGNRRAHSDSGSSGGSIRIDVNLTGGTYYLMLQPSNGPAQTGAYRINITQ